VRGKPVGDEARHNPRDSRRQLHRRALATLRLRRLVPRPRPPPLAASKKGQTPLTQ
jgi:hypothetical protein